VNDRGFFQIADPPPGRFLLVAKQPGFADANVSLQVIEGQEAELVQALVLTPAERLELFIQPPTDPSGALWQVTLLSLASHSNALLVEEGALVSSDGYFSLDGLSHGRYRLMIGGYMGKVYTEEIELHENPVPLYVDLDFVNLTGRLRLANKPLAGRVIFGGAYGAVSIPFEADSEGRFGGLLPGGGMWSVEIEGQSPRVHRVLRTVEVKATENGEAFVVIDLPNTHLSGTVVDERGRAPARSYVSVQSLHKSDPDPAFQELPDSNGRFSIAGLEPGMLQVSASAVSADGRLLESEQVILDLQENLHREIQLVARETVLITGVVFSSEGSVANAMVVVQPVDDPNRPVAPQFTDADGSFESRVPPAGAPELYVQVEAVGYAYRMLRVRPDSDNRIEIPVDQAAGTIIVETKGPLFDATAPLLLLHGGGLEYLSSFQGWAAVAGGEVTETRITIPMMEPGDYKLCQAFLPEVRQIATGALNPGRCVEGILYVGSELNLSVLRP